MKNKLLDYQKKLNLSRIKKQLNSISKILAFPKFPQETINNLLTERYKFRYKIKGSAQKSLRQKRVNPSI
jgi:hypothetical protein